MVLVLSLLIDPFMWMLYPIHVKSDERRHNNWVRLPLLKPQPVGGRLLEFPQWQVAFETLMSQADVNDTHRFYYLKDSLSGPAL